MEQGRRLCPFDNVSQDVVNTSVAKVANNIHPVPNAGLRQFPNPVFAASNLETEEDNPGWSTLTSDGSQ